MDQQTFSQKATVPAVTGALSDNPTVIDASWYLGGNHNVKLLFSVDGDLDPNILDKLTGVPSAVGELALSVESLVSHDLTVGGFEIDILAKIAFNTLAGRQSGDAGTPSKPVAIEVIKYQRSPSMESFGVPNPLADSTYKPVPNPLAAPVTPPDSPVSLSVPSPISFPAQISRKRKNSPLVQTVPKAKKAARRKGPVKAATQSRR
jgi:hypothetical protein